MINITPKQKAVFDFLTSFIHKNHYSPTLKEIASHFKKTSATINQYLKALEQKNLIARKKGSIRGINLTGDPFASVQFQTQAKIGIIGYGIVGQAVGYGFSNEEIHIYDKYKEFETLAETVKKSDYIFVCLPTPIKANETGIDLSIVNRSVAKIAKLAAKTDKIIIVKSTVVPGTTAKLIKKYPQCLFCFNPEFLTERSFLQDFINADRIVIGTQNDFVFRRVAALYQKMMPKTPIFQTDPTTAEMVKYMANCFLATKVILANEMYEICEKLKIKYEEVKKMVVADYRIHDSHLEVTTVRGFGGKCFPKDLLALRALAKQKDVDTKILDAVWAKNLKIRKVHDWDLIPFAVSQNGFGQRG